MSNLTFYEWWQACVSGGVLGVDVGKTTGYAYGTLDGEIGRTGLIKLTSTAKSFKLLVAAEKLFGELIEEFDPCFVAFEAPFTSKGFAGIATKLFIHGIFRLVLDRKDIPHGQVYPSTLKKFITGSGRSSKEEVRDKILFLYPELTLPSLDISDACGVLLWGINERIK